MVGKLKARFAGLRPWLRPLLIVAGAIFLYGSGWFSGSTGNFVKRLTEIVSVKREVETNLDQALSKLRTKEQETERLIEERLNLQKVIDAIRKSGAASPLPDAAPDSSSSPRIKPLSSPVKRSEPKARPRVAARPVARKRVAARSSQVRSRRAADQPWKSMRWEIMTIPDPGPKSQVVLRRVCDHPLGGRCK